MHKRFVLLCSVFFSVACYAQTQKLYTQDQFINLLNIEKGAAQEPEGFIFSDLGDWHGYGLYNKDSTIYAGAFRGPAFITGREVGLKWLSEGFEKLTLSSSNDKIIPYTKIAEPQYIPGMLRQTLHANNLDVLIREIAISNRSTMTTYTITNNSKKQQDFKIDFTGAITCPSAEITDASDILTIAIDKGQHNFVFSLPAICKITALDRKSYQAKSGLIVLGPLKSRTFCSFTTFCPYSNIEQAQHVHKRDINHKEKIFFSQNKVRWQGYLNKILNAGTVYLKSERNRNWAVKALMTLNTNWRSAAGDLKHGGVVPATGTFDAFWSWDSWEHAVALAIFNPKLAEDQLRTLFDFQTPEGMVIDFISANASENNTKCSKPPIAGWALYMVFQQTKDTAFVREMFPKLLRFHEWHYKYRDHDHNGLCEYGGTGPNVVFGQWESGMDVAVKFNGAKMLENSPGAYSLDQESVELNSYLCAEKFYLSFLANIIGKPELSSKLKKEGESLKKMIQEKFFDTQTGYFYDRKVGTGKLVKIMDISGWIPLFTGVATAAQAAAVKKNMLDTSLFGTYFPFSSLNHKHPLYNPGAGYFRGQVWMNYIYFGIRGFKNYGYTKEANKYTALIPDKLKGIADPGYPIRENYNAETGKGLDAKNFSWSSAFSLLLLTEDSWRFPYIVK